jgi:hypothetical protein
MFHATLVITQEVSMDSLKRIDDAGERLIAAVRTAQDWAAWVAEKIGPPIVRLIPDLPVPEALRLPRPRDVAASTFEFWQELGKAQSEFTLRVLDAFDPAAHRAKHSRHAKAA